MRGIRIAGASAGVCALAVIYACTGEDPLIAGSDDAGSSPPDVSSPSDTGGGNPLDNAVGDASCGDLTSDDQNCGACGHKCAADEGCFASACVKQSIEVSAGATSACAIRKDGTVWCWGENRFGEIGVDAVNDVTCQFPCQPRAVQVPGLAGVVHVSVGYEYACAVDSANIVKCWGKNHRYQLGHDNTGDALSGSVYYRYTPTKVQGLPAMSSVTCGTEFTCGVSTTGGVWCWGNGGDVATQNLYDTTDAAAPVLSATPVAAVTDLSSGVDGLVLAVTYDSSIGYGSNHMCAHKTDGTVWCWAESAHGCRGAVQTNGTLANRVLLVDGGGASGLGRPTSGFLSSCALDGVGNLQCWGWDAYGAFAQGGAGSSSDFPYATAVTTSAPKLVSISGVQRHTCGVAADKSVWCWGSNGSGELGTGTADAGANGVTGTPVQVPGFKAKSVAAGGRFTVAIREDGTVWAWGNNSDSQVGHPYSTSDVADCISPQAGEPKSYCTPTPSRVLATDPDGGLDAGL